MQQSCWKKRTGFQLDIEETFSSRDVENAGRTPHGGKLTSFKWERKDREERGKILACHLISFPFSRLVFDPVYKEFPTLRRDDPYFQEFKVQLTRNGTRLGTSGFLELYNATTGEIVPSCDQQFTIRNAQVVCRELGFNTQNAYHWITPRYDYDPKLILVKTYMEPRECRGNERRLDKCPLRLAANDSMWQCSVSFHNYIHCGPARSLNMEYGGR